VIEESTKVLVDIADDAHNDLTLLHFPTWYWAFVFSGPPAVIPGNSYLPEGVRRHVYRRYDEPKSEITSDEKQSLAESRRDHSRRSIEKKKSEGRIAASSSVGSDITAIARLLDETARVQSAAILRRSYDKKDIDLAMDVARKYLLKPYQQPKAVGVKRKMDFDVAVQAERSELSKLFKKPNESVDDGCYQRSFHRILCWFNSSDDHGNGFPRAPTSIDDIMAQLPPNQEEQKSFWWWLPSELRKKRTIMLMLEFLVEQKLLIVADDSECTYMFNWEVEMKNLPAWIMPALN